jgi:hypothetical protein
MSAKEAILNNFGSLLRTRPTTALWLFSLAMAAQSKPVAQRVLARYVTRGPLIREMIASQEQGLAVPENGQAGSGACMEGWAVC